jgi:hypothetical protein
LHGSLASFDLAAVATCGQWRASIVEPGALSSGASQGGRIAPDRVTLTTVPTVMEID